MNIPEPCLCGDPCCRRCFRGGCGDEECPTCARRPPDDGPDPDDWRDE